MITIILYGKTCLPVNIKLSCKGITFKIKPGMLEFQIGIHDFKNAGVKSHFVYFINRID